MELLLSLSAGLSAIAYLIIALITGIRLGAIGYLIVPALLFSSIWSIYGAMSTQLDLIWLGFWSGGLLAVLRRLRDLDTSRFVWFTLLLVPVISFLAGIFLLAAPAAWHLWPLLFAAVGILLITEQVIRATRRYMRAIAICVGTLFLFEVYVITRVASSDEFANDLLHARVLLNVTIALALCLMPLFLKEESRATRKVSLSRPMAFTTTSLLVAGGTVTIVTLASLVIESRVGLYRQVWQPFLLFGLVLLLGINLRSSTQRAKIRVWINKNFFKTKYDYNLEWQNLTDRLASDASRDFGDTALRAVSSVYHSPRALLFLEQESQLYCQSSLGELAGISPLKFEDHKAFIEKVRTGWIFVTQSEESSLTRYNDVIPEAITQLGEQLIITPLLRQASIVGLIVMAVDDQYLDEFDFEDIDLLRLIGSQVANYLAYQQLAQTSAIQGQFETYHQISTFVMHDLKNLIAQQMLVVQNAARFRDNPEFVSDAITTIENSVKRMNRLMLKINQHSTMPTEGDHQEKISLADAFDSAMVKCSNREPKPTITGCDPSYVVLGDPDSLVMAMTHILSNAQEACSANDTISVTVEKGEDNHVICKITDTGSGMDQEFIDQRLFKPFDSTKKTVGMGIGAYQSKQIISKMRGQISVSSTLGEGTCFTIRLPLVKS